MPEAPREPGSPTPPRLELRLERGRVAVGLGAGPLPGGLVLLDLELEVEGLPSPFDPGAGTSPFRSLPCALRRLEVASDGASPGADALHEVLAAALASSGWPLPGTSGLVHSTWSDGRGSGASWVRPADQALAMLASASEAAARGEPDLGLRLALAGHAAIAAGLTPEGVAALRAALDAGLGKDDAREAWRALVAAARGSGDDAAERQGLAGLVPAAPTGERPALLLRLSALDLAAGDADASRLHAEEARTLAPRDPVATEACLACALRAGDGAAAIDLLDRLATLEPATAGDRLLDRARRLAAAGRLLEADVGFRDAIAKLPADRALADEHAALRRASPPPVGRHPWGEPLEAFAGRVGEAPDSARAFRDAALLAREQGDLPSALRAARRAHERSGDVAFAGELLASLLHAGGSVREALDLHKILLAQAAHTLDPAALADRLTALAELAEEAGDRPLAVESLDRLIEQRPHDAQALAWRFRVDPDRVRALDRLAAGAEEIRSRRSRSRLLGLAAAAARDEAVRRRPAARSPPPRRRGGQRLARGRARGGAGAARALPLRPLRRGERALPGAAPGGRSRRPRRGIPGARRRRPSRPGPRLPPRHGGLGPGRVGRDHPSPRGGAGGLRGLAARRRHLPRRAGLGRGGRGRDRGGPLPARRRGPGRGGGLPPGPRRPAALRRPSRPRRPCLRGLPGGQSVRRRRAGRPHRGPQRRG